MKKILFTFLICLTGMISWSQAAFVIPSPTNPNNTVTIYIDVSQTTGGLKTMLGTHPEYVDSLYIWTWMPAGPVCGNGDWGASNNCMKLTHVNALLFSFEMIPTQFYNVSPIQFFQNGISCLAKMKNGNAFASDGVGEAKTEDLKIDIIPALCAERFCYFPEAARADDYLSITYDNNQETDVNLQGLADGDCYLYMVAKTGTFTVVEYAPVGSVTSTPELQMKPVVGKPGFFRMTIIPGEFFSIPEGTQIQQVKFYVVKPGYAPGPPTYTNYAPLYCD